jgi:hypothetical protein
MRSKVERHSEEAEKAVRDIRQVQIQSRDRADRKRPQEQLPTGVPPEGTHYGKNSKEMARVAVRQLLH